MTWDIIESCVSIVAALVFVLFMYFQRKANDELIERTRKNDAAWDAALAALQAQTNHIGYRVAAIQTKIHYVESGGYRPSDSSTQGDS